MKLKVAQFSPPIIPTPPPLYGGVEKIASHVTEELVQRGHDVTLYATGDSITKAKLKYMYKKSIGINKFDPSQGIAHGEMCFDDADKYDIIHNHFGIFGIALAKYMKTPVVTTMHNDYCIPGTPEWNYFKNACYYVTISRKQAERNKGLNIVQTVHNAIDVNKYPLQEDKEDFLLFLGNMWVMKGPDVAIKVARTLRKKLVMVGKVDKKFEEFFLKNIKPHIDGKKIVYYDSVSEKKKIELYQKAKCVLFPIRWEEPFGLVLIEAMSSGTPVVAFGRGSVPEIIKHGKTGFVVNTYSQFLNCVKKIDEINPKTCNQHVKENFSIEKMTDGYEEVYRKILEK